MLLLINVSKVFACSCIGERSVQEEVKYTDAVIVGTIISEKLIIKSNKEIYPPVMLKQYSLVVENIYKGKITSDTVTVFTGVGNGDCGVNFTVGEKYIIYGQIADNDIPLPKRKNIFWTHICTRTTLFQQKEITEIERYAKNKFHK
ncbi:MAG: hypothetical protein LBR55_04755 [Bacteroidales bacterium]|nr:hypothetical protein [Bacteroidales bacterium]